MPESERTHALDKGIHIYDECCAKRHGRRRILRTPTWWRCSSPSSSVNCHKIWEGSKNESSQVQCSLLMMFARISVVSDPAYNGTSMQVRSSGRAPVPGEPKATASQIFDLIEKKLNSKENHENPSSYARNGDHGNESHASREGRHAGRAFASGARS